MTKRMFCLILGLALLVLEMAPAALAAPINPLVQADQTTPVGQKDNSVKVEFLGVTRPLREMVPNLSVSLPGTLKEVDNLPRPQVHSGGSQSVPAIDTALQTEYPKAPDALSIVQNFAGTGRVEPVLPPDPSMDVGPNHVISLVNLHYKIFDKSGTSLAGPYATNTLWSSGQCGTQNDGDGVVLYDQLADRWLIGQFAVTNGSTSGFYYCLAVSQTADPTGTWYQYAFNFGTATFIDYPKLGIWPDGYYFSANTFNAAGSQWTGTEACAFQRSVMLTGATPLVQCWANGTTPPTDYYSLLPADLDGYNLPASGEPEHFAENYSTTRYDILDMHIDWTTPTNSTFTLVKSLTVSSFNYLCLGNAACIPEPFPGRPLDALGDRLMYRLPYRAFNGFSSMVLNNTVQVGTGPNRAGIRWYEFRNSVTPYSAANWTVYQQSTYDPGNALSRWMGSIAMNKFGDIALGYSTSNSSHYPSISFTGRLGTDALNSMTLGETLIQAGASSQTAGNRWGDYTQMVVDPFDDCTFWYTNEYLTSGQTVWNATKIAAFRLNTTTCNGSPTAVLIESYQVEPFTGTVLIQWQTASEINLVGFKLYRTLEPDGGMQAITQGLLPAKNPGQLLGASYQYVDTNVSAGKTYSYTLQVFTTDGLSENYNIGTVVMGWVNFLPFMEH
jgi:hypothetical protein